MINLFNEDVRFPLDGQRKQVKEYLKKLISDENKKPGEINIIFCSDEYLLEINKKHLNHHYYTDVITFDHSEYPTIAGDLFISTDTVRSNALQYKVSFENELHRVIFHGVLHLCGYKDKLVKDKQQMRAKENQYLEMTVKTM